MPRARNVGTRLVLVGVVSQLLGWGCLVSPEGGGGADASPADAIEERAIDGAPENMDADAEPGDSASEAEAGQADAESAEAGQADAESEAGQADAESPEADVEGPEASKDSTVEDAPLDSFAANDAGEAGAADWCVDGTACVSSNQCHVGALACAQMVCTDTGVALTNGTPCTSGTCQNGACTETCSGPFNVSLENCQEAPCAMGSCNVPSGDLDASVGFCALPPRPDLVPDMTPCGNGHQVCSNGACIVVECASDRDCGQAQSCQFTKCIANPCMNYGVAVPDFTACGSGRVCIGPQCRDQLTTNGAAVSFTPGSAFNGTVATVSDTVTSDSAASLQATIDWGDGTTSPGTISGSAGQFTVTGNHTYSIAYVVTGNVTVVDVAGGFTVYGSFPAGPQANYTDVAYVGAAGPGIAFGSDGNLWLASGSVTRLTPAGVITYFKTPGYPVGSITAGPDGNLWFGEQGAIGRITPAGVLTEFPLSTTNAAPVAIVSGADGNLWFADVNDGVIGRITPSGSETEWPLPASSGAISDLAGDPGGTMWFCEDSGKIGTIDGSGAMTELDLPTPGTPYGIILGPDNNLWVTVRAPSSGGSERIDRVTTSGTITEFAIPTPSVTPGHIAAGPDGALWFAEATSPAIGRVTTAGVVSGYLIPAFYNASSTPRPSAGGMVAGDGALWFVWNQVAYVGRISP